MKPQHLAILLSALAMTACPLRPEFARTAPGGQPGRHHADDIVLVYGSAPDRSHIVIGRIQTEGDPAFANEGKALDVLRQGAADAGADGVMGVYCGGQGTVGYGKCSGTAFVWQ